MAPDTAPPSVPAWHTLGCDAVSARAGSDQLRGLSEADAAARLARDGRNVIREGARRSKLRMLLAQFTDFLILLLIAAAIVSGIVGDVEDTVVILGIVVLNATVGFVQEYRADRAVAALKRMAAFNAMVVRNGHQQVVPRRSGYQGDIVLLEAGNALPADLSVPRSGRSQTGGSGTYR